MVELIIIVLLLYLIFGNTEGFSAHDPVRKANAFYKTKEAMRKLFSERSMWIKTFVEDNLQGQTDRSHIYNRLLKNQNDIGNYIGAHIKNPNTAVELTRLLKEHVSKITSMINQIQTQNKNYIEEAVENVEQNSQEFAKFLASHGEEYLPYDSIKQLFDKQNKLIYKMATHHFLSEHKKEVDSYDKFYDVMLKLSDTLHAGLHYINGD